ncbi:aldehyde dehydrogenase [Gluconobacter albidus NBRC 3250]|nr:aldehyde dehydrogenase [Gluconobacter albidus NBRC 3250]
MAVSDLILTVFWRFTQTGKYVPVRGECFRDHLDVRVVTVCEWDKCYETQTGRTMAASLRSEVTTLLDSLGVSADLYTRGTLAVTSPLTGERIAEVAEISAEDAKATIGRAAEAFRVWRTVPAPRRGELVRLLGEELRANKEALGRLVTLEVGKVPSEGLGEVQEMIDICDFAVGLSRQLYGLTIPSERPDHRLTEQWHPAGPVGIISAFNFPVAVWSWNAALALVCGDSVIWKPSEKTPLTALATQALFLKAAARFGTDAPAALSTLLVGGRDIGELMVEDRRVPVISATGSTRMGRDVGERVARRFGHSILELGGNNASIVTPSADLDLTLRAVAFGAMGTAGQRCTTLRRLFVHSSVYDTLVPKLVNVYRSISVGNPIEGAALVGPLIDAASFTMLQDSLKAAADAGGTVHGGTRVDVNGEASFYARPALVEMPSQVGPVLEETFAPILYVMKYDTLEEAIALQNDVVQGLSSSIFATDIREVEQFLSARGSDCGIANVNMGPSGAEIGGAFGGEKETGGGRESGSDSWKAYMRRQTNAINYGRTLPLAQGVTFDVDGGSTEA